MPAAGGRCSCSPVRSSARDETLHRLRVEYLFAAPAALLLAIIAGYGLAAASLTPG